MNKAVIKALAPRGELRAAINMSNFLLVSGQLPDNTADGVSPDIAKEIARRLDVPCRLVPFDGPGQIADAVNEDVWDIGNIALEPQRAKTIDFSIPYIRIDANFLIREGASFISNADIDKPGVTIILYARSAYDLWLSNNFHQPDFLRVGSIQESHDMFYAGSGDVLASLKPKLVDELAKTKGFRIIETPFTSINQSVGIAKGHPEAVAFLNEVIVELNQSGFIKASLKQHGVTEKLSLVML